MEILSYIFIFVAKLVEVTMMTLRVVLVNRGEKLKGAILGFFEIMIWVIVVSNVLSSLSEDPIKAVMYCLAFACGNYLGVILENKFAIGTACIWAVVGQECKDELTQKLREQGYGVTTIKGQGMEKEVDVLLIYLTRKRVPDAVALIRQYKENALITVNDVRQVRNGYIKK